MTPELVYEEMTDAIDKMVIARIADGHPSGPGGCNRHPEAEAELSAWFAERGITLTFLGWDEYDRRNR
jgi:hypothetical protein